MKELIGLAQSGSGAVQRELHDLTASGLLTVKHVGNQKHYQANPNSPVFHEIRTIIQKTIGLGEPLRRALGSTPAEIVAAFVYGSVAKKTDTPTSDIDLMIISDDLSYGDLFAALERTSVTLGRPVNPTILSRQEFCSRVAKHESFLTRVMEQAKIWIVGDEIDFNADAAEWTGKGATR